MKYTFLIILALSILSTAQAQDLSALDIIKKSDEQQRGDYNQDTIKMTTIPPIENRIL